MASYAADVETGARVPQALSVRCRGRSGTLEILPNGDVSFKPAMRSPSMLSWLRCLVIFRKRVKPLVIPGHQLIGARHEGVPGSFSVWWATEHSQKKGLVTRHKFKVHQSDTFESGDPEAANALVTHLQRTSSWWGRAQPPHVFAIVNPISGRGKSRRVAQEQVLPLLRDVAGLRVTAHVTKGPMHAAELVAGMDLSGEGAVDMVAFFGGDGTVYEGVQGVFQRSDWQAACQVPMAIIPSGSGNGLAGSAGLWDFTTAAVGILRGHTAPIDVASVLQPPGRRSYALLSVVYGAFSNLDVGTNHLRFLGPTRFHLGAIWELLKGKNYKCRCFILPPEAAPAATDSASTTTPNGPAGNAAADATSSSATSDTTPLLNRLQKTPTAELRGSAAGLGLSQPTRLSDYPSGPPLPVLSQLSTLPGPLPDTPAPLPPGWVQLSDVNSFAMFLGINPQFTSLDARINPGGSFGDGAWDVWYLEAETEKSLGLPVARRRATWAQRLRYLRVLLGVEDGSFATGTPAMAHAKCRALMMEQTAEDTWTVLDGEAVPPVPLYLEVHPQLMRLCVSPRFAEPGI